jgi:hypothetical protein
MLGKQKRALGSRRQFVCECAYMSALSLGGFAKSSHTTCTVPVTYNSILHRERLKEKSFACEDDTNIVTRLEDCAKDTERCSDCEMLRRAIVA